jgi:hypothetical protein
MALLCKQEAQYPQNTMAMILTSSTFRATLGEKKKRLSPVFF